MATNNRQYLLFGLLTLFWISNASTFDCTGLNACRNDIINCTQNESCTLNCNGNHACRRVQFYCADGYLCNVNCVSGAFGVCRDLRLFGESASALSVIADTDDTTTSTHDSRIFCPTNGIGSCSIICNGTGDCNRMTINGRQSGSLTVASNRGRLGVATIRCPSPCGSCNIFLSENVPNNAMNAMVIYSSIFDVNITCNAKISDCYTNSSSVGVVPRLCCHGNTCCEIERDIIDTSLWKCTDPTHECNSYSVNPTEMPTNNPTQGTHSPSNSPTIHTSEPTQIPSNNPSEIPSNNPTLSPIVIQPPIQSPTREDISGDGDDDISDDISDDSDGNEDSDSDSDSSDAFSNVQKAINNANINDVNNVNNKMDDITYKIEFSHSTLGFIWSIFGAILIMNLCLFYLCYHLKKNGKVTFNEMRG